MAWERKAQKALFAALEVDDLQLFVELLKQYPDNLRFKGRPTWLNDAAWEGRLDLVKLLVDMGLDVNEPVSEIAGPEGVVDSAAGRGHLEIVRWLLDHGAVINHEVNGQIRCLGLARAAMNGHLDVVKLLVERGADVHSAWHGMNALMQARLYGADEVAAYLESIGCRDVREYTPPDHPAAHDEIRRIVSDWRGELSDLRVESPGDPPIEIRSTRPGERWDSQTVFTVGTSDRDLKSPDGSPMPVELMLTLPPDWPLTDASLADPAWNWPIAWLQRLSRELLAEGSWPTHARLFADAPPQPFAENTRLCAWLGLPADGSTVQMPDYRWVTFVTLFAIHEEERQLVERDGHDALLERFRQANLPLYVALDRENVAV